MPNVNTNKIIKTSSPPLSSTSSPPSFFTITFEDGFIGMEIRNRRAVKNGAMVRKFHLNKDGRIGQAQATGKIKRYMQLLSVNRIICATHDDLKNYFFAKRQTTTAVFTFPPNLSF